MNLRRRNKVKEYEKVLDDVIEKLLMIRDSEYDFNNLSLVSLDLVINHLVGSSQTLFSGYKLWKRGDL